MCVWVGENMLTDFKSYAQIRSMILRSISVHSDDQKKKKVVDSKFVSQVVSLTGSEKSVFFATEVPQRCLAGDASHWSLSLSGIESGMWYFPRCSSS